MKTTIGKQFLLPEHGFLNCKRCFAHPDTKAQEWQGKFRWRLEHGPAAWGSRNPLVLILGFSRGDAGTKAMNRGPFNEIPFLNMRPNIERVLYRLKILPEGIRLTQKIHDQEKDFAFGSMIRCSIAKWDSEKEKFIKSGKRMLTDCVYDFPSSDILRSCTATFQSELPERLMLVLLMGNEREYVKGCFEAIKSIRPTLEMLEPVRWKGKEHPVAYNDGRVTWCHFPHAAGHAISHLIKWDERDDQLQSKKRVAAIEAVRLSGVLSLLK